MVEPISGTLPADWQDRVVEKRYNIYVGSSETPLDQSYIVMNSEEFTEMICDGKFHFGGVIASKFVFSVNADCIQFGNDEIWVEQYIRLDTDDEYIVPIGDFLIDWEDSLLHQGERTFEGNFVAYDAFVSVLDKKLSQSDVDRWNYVSPTGEPLWEHTLENLTIFIDDCISDRIRLDAASRAVIEAHDNNDRLVNYENNAAAGYNLYKAFEAEATYRDVLSSVAALVGGAFKIDRTTAFRSGGVMYKLILFEAEPTVVKNLDASQRITSSINTQDGKPIIRTINFGTTEVNNPIEYLDHTDLTLSLGDNLLLPYQEEYVKGEQQHPAVLAVLRTLSSQTGNYHGSTSTGDPLVLTNADISYFGNPTIEAGDFIRSSTINGNTDFYVLEHIYRLRQPSTIRSYGAVNNSLYTSSYSPSYGETTKRSGYDAATSKQIAQLASQSSADETTIAEHTQQLSDISDDITAINSSISDLTNDVSDISDDLDDVREMIMNDYAIYSISEHRVGTWIDDKELYEKTFEISPLGDSSTRSVSVPIGVSLLQEVVESKGQALGSGFSLPLPYMPIDSTGQVADAENGIYYIINGGSLVISNGITDMSNCKAYITIRYTKSSLPDWLPSGALELLDSIPNLSDYYCDLAYESGGYYDYFRIFCTPDSICSLQKENNHYQVFQVPYVDTFRGFSTRHLSWSPSAPYWNNAGDVLNTDRGSTVMSNQNYDHKAIILSTLQSFINATGEAFEDYREGGT